MHIIWTYLKEHRRTLLLALFLAAINQIFSLLDPQIFRILIDNYANRAGELSSEEFFRGVLLLILASMGVAFVSRVAKSFQDYYVNVITEQVGAKMYATSVKHSFSLPFAVFEDQRSGEVLQKMAKARSDAQGLIASAINILFFSLIGIVFVMIYSFWVHWSIGLIYFTIIPLLGWVTYQISRRIKNAQAAIVRETSELAGSTTETLRNVELVKSLGLEAQETRRLNEVNTKILSLELKKVKMLRALNFIQGTLINSLRQILQLLMLYLVFSGEITLGEFFSVLFYSFAIFTPLGELGTVSAKYQEAKASSGILAELLATPSEPQPENPETINSIDSIEFKNTVFQYASGDLPSVKDTSLKIQNGETVAFVGPSGSGKTTLVKLIVGLYKPTGGEIRINNIPGSRLDYRTFRNRIGYVSQETQLFAGTIRENLLFVNPDATDEDCLKALKAAAAEKVIERGDKGLDTKIGEGGLKLSGGERQRLAIARALLRNPEVIIFDEATSSLDSLTEKSITETIKAVSQNRKELITILIAHRLSTIAHADRIYVLEKGQIVEVGSHQKLLEEKGLYYALWREQSAVAEVPTS